MKGSKANLSTLAEKCKVSSLTSLSIAFVSILKVIVLMSSLLHVQTIIVSNWKGYLNTIKPEDKARSFATSSQY